LIYSINKHVLLNNYALRGCHDIHSKLGEEIMPGAVAMENTLGYLATVAKVPWRLGYIAFSDSCAFS